MHARKYDTAWSRSASPYHRLGNAIGCATALCVKPLRSCSGFWPSQCCSRLRHINITSRDSVPLTGCGLRTLLWDQLDAAFAIPCERLVEQLHACAAAPVGPAAGSAAPALLAPRPLWGPPARRRTSFSQLPFVSFSHCCRPRGFARAAVQHSNRLSLLTPMLAAVEASSCWERRW